MCGEEIEGQRSTRKFCSGTCRAKYSALPARIETAVVHALTSITTAHALIERHPEFRGTARPMLENVIERAKEALPRKPYTRREK